MLDGPGLDDLPAQALYLSEGSFLILAHERGEAHHVSRKNGCQTSLDLWLARAAHVRSPRGRPDGASLRRLRPGKEINEATLERSASVGQAELSQGCSMVLRTLVTCCRRGLMTASGTKRRWTERLHLHGEQIFTRAG